jgi:membrane protein
LILLLQSSWIVVLLGAELTFANQNFLHYELEAVSLNVGNYQKRALVIMILHMIIHNFSIGERPVSAETLAHDLKIPVRLARDILQDLTNAKLVSVLHENEHKERLYQPAMDINKLTISFVFARLDKKGTGQIVVSRSKDYGKVISILEKFDRLIAKSDANILIKDL